MTAQQAREIVKSRLQSTEEIEKWVEIMAHNGATDYFTKGKMTKDQQDYFKSRGFTVSEPITDPNVHKISW